MPKPDADLCMRVDLPLDKKTVENQDWTGLGHRAAGPSRAVGRGPLGRGPAFSKTPWESINFVTPWVTTNKFGECVFPDVVANSGKFPNK